MKIGEAVGTAIKRCRELSGMSQVELAKAAGMSKSYLSLIESGDRVPGIDVLNKISNKLGVPLSVIVFMGTDSAMLPELDKDSFKSISVQIQKSLANVFEKSQKVEI